MLLDVAGDGVEVAGADVAGCFAPCLEGGTSGGDGGVDIGFVGVRNLRELLPVGGVGAVDVGVGLGLNPRIINEQAELAVVFVQPIIDIIRRFGRGAVGHGLKNL